METEYSKRTILDAMSRLRKEFNGEHRRDKPGWFGRVRNLMTEMTALASRLNNRDLLEHTISFNRGDGWEGEFTDGGEIQMRVLLRVLEQRVGWWLDKDERL